MFSCYKFQERKQQQGETFETFVTDLRNLVKDCNYDKPSEMVRDRIVAGNLSQDIREKLLTEGDTHTMDKATDLAVTYETTQQCLKSMATSATPTRVDAIRQKRQEAPRQQKRQEDKIQYRHHEVIDCQNCGGNTSEENAQHLVRNAGVVTSSTTGQRCAAACQGGVQHQQ